MTTSELLKRVPIPRHKLYYLEQKGYIQPRRVPRGELEARVYTAEDCEMVRLIWKYLQQGYRHRVAYRKALEERSQQAPQAKAAHSPGTPVMSQGRADGGTRG